MLTMMKNNMMLLLLLILLYAMFVSKNNVGTSIKNSMDYVVDDKTVNGVLLMMLLIYAVLFAPLVNELVIMVFNDPFFKLLYLLMVCYYSMKQPCLALLMIIIYFITNQAISNYEINENIKLIIMSNDSLVLNNDLNNDVNNETKKLNNDANNEIKKSNNETNNEIKKIDNDINNGTKKSNKPIVEHARLNLSGLQRSQMMFNNPAGNPLFRQKPKRGFF